MPENYSSVRSEGVGIGTCLSLLGIAFVIYTTLDV